MSRKSLWKMAIGQTIKRAKRLQGAKMPYRLVVKWQRKNCCMGASIAQQAAASLARQPIGSDA